MRFSRRMIAAALVLAALAPILRAADAPANPPDLLTLKMNRIVIFKDGYGLVFKEGSATADAQGRVYTAAVPDSAVLGTVWAFSDKDKLLSMTSQWDNKHEVRAQESPCLTVRELLRANLKRKVTLELDDKRTFSGIAAEIMETPEPSTPLAPASEISAFGTPPFTLETNESFDPFTTAGRELSFPDGARLVREITPKGGDFVVLNNDADRQVIPISKILSVSGHELVTTMTRQKDVYSRTKHLTFDFGKESAGKPVALHFCYFTPGFRWTPTYRVTGTLKDSPDGANLALQGEISNDLEDIVATNVDLVVGVPNFRFKDSPSPLTLETVVRRAAVSAGLRNDFNGQVLNSQFANFSNAAYVPSQPEAPNVGLPAALAAGLGGEQDLFVYPLENFSLKKGGRATAALWQNSAPVRNVYTYEIKGRRNPVSGGVSYSSGTATASPNRIAINDIWHQLELTNNSKVPWTTGAALTLKDALPLGQDILTYTSVGSKTLLPLTIAVDLRGATDEVEIARKPNAARFDNYDYSLITKKGTISLTNSRKEDSNMCVSIALGGRAESASDNGTIKLNDYRAEDWDNNGNMQVNNHSDINWEFVLKPGETRKIDYTVSFYVR